MCYRCDDQLVGPCFPCIDDPPQIEFDKNGSAILRDIQIGSVTLKKGWLMRDVKLAVRQMKRYRRLGLL
jgi:hypothetical protein